MHVHVHYSSLTAAEAPSCFNKVSRYWVCGGLIEFPITGQLINVTNSRSNYGLFLFTISEK